MSKSLARVAQIAGSTVVSRVLGLARDALAVKVFGAGELNSAFLTAYTLPNLFRRLLGEGQLTGAMVPVLTEELREGGQPAAFRLMNQVFSWLLLVSSALVGLVWAALALASRAPGVDSRWQLALELAQTLLPYLIFACVAAIQAAALNVLGHFAAPALSQVWLNLSMIVSLNVLGLWLADTPRGQMAWLCGGVLFGGLLQVAVPAASLWRLGWRPRWAPQWSPRVREIALLMLPSLAGAAIYQVNLAASRFFAYDLSESATTLLFLASRLMELPIGVFSVSVATVVFPVMAQALVDHDAPRFRAAFHDGTRLTLAITAPAAVGLALLGEPIGRVLFERGQFGPEDTALLAPVLAVYACGLPFYSLVLQCTRAFHARKDMRAPVIASALSLAVNVAGSLALPQAWANAPAWWGPAALALATNLALVAQAMWLVWRIERVFPGLRLRALWADGLKIAAGCLAMGLAVWAAWSALRALASLSWWHEAAVLAAIIAGAVALYAWALWALRITGRDKLALMLQRRRIFATRPRPASEPSPRS